MISSSSSSSHPKILTQVSPQAHPVQLPSPDDARQERLEGLFALERATRDGDAVEDSKEGAASPQQQEYARSVLSAWREKVTQWYYDVIDELGEPRPVVYVALSILDRYCVRAYRSTTWDETRYEVVCMTALFIAVRIVGSGRLSLPQLLSFSRRGVQLRDVVSIGTTMVKTLRWENKVVTPFDFLDAFLDCHLPSLDKLARRRILEAARYLVEIAVFDTTLCGCRPSHLAWAAMQNASEADRETIRGNNAPTSAVIRQAVALRVPVCMDSHVIGSIQCQLRGMHRQSAGIETSRSVPLHWVGSVEENGLLCDQTKKHHLHRTVSLEGLDLNVIPEDEPDPMERPMKKRRKGLGSCLDSVHDTEQH